MFFCSCGLVRGDQVNLSPDWVTKGAQSLELHLLVTSCVKLHTKGVCCTAYAV